MREGVSTVFTCIDGLHPDDQALVQTAYDHFHTRDIDKTLKLLNSRPQPEPEPAPQSLNSLCRRGSGLKFKRCCGAKPRRAVAAAPSNP